MPLALLSPQEAVTVTVEGEGESWTCCSRELAMVNFTGATDAGTVSVGNQGRPTLTTTSCPERSPFVRELVRDRTRAWILLDPELLFQSRRKCLHILDRQTNLTHIV
ncbi:MAG TPA: hypothetical protein VF043_19930 [Ktedonobacteraceae bacterium]